MSTLRVSNIEAKADPSSPSVDEKLKVTNSNGDILVHIDGKTAGVTTIGINTTDRSFTVDAAQNVEFLGIVTATKFSLSGGGEITGGDGNFTGIVTSGSGNFTGGLSVGTAVTAATANFTSSLTAASANFTGNVSIAGTLTYEDVTNVDSVGIATARDGIDVTGGNIDLVDDSKIRFGTGDDLEIEHDTSQAEDLNVIKSASNLQLQIRADKLRIIDTDATQDLIHADVDSSAKLFYAGSKKLETTTTGAKVTGSVEVTQEYPTIRPTLDLNFAATKVLDDRITFTRDGVGTYIDEDGVLKYASNNTPRFDHDLTTGESLGLLIEQSSTNLFLHGENFTAGYWTKNGGGNPATTVTADQAAAPDGTMTADYIDYTTATGNSQNIERQFDSTPAGKTYTASVFIKGTAGQTINLTLDGYGVNGSASQHTLNGNWQRFSITRSYPSGHTQAAIFRFGCRNLNHPSTGTATQIYAWGAQLEQIAFSTSYIPSSSTGTVSRAADIPKIEGTNLTSFYNDTEGTVFAEYQNLKTGDTNGRVWDIGNNQNQTFVINAASSTTVQGQFYNISGNGYEYNPGTVSATNAFNKVALGMKNNNTNLCVNGTLGTDDTSITLIDFSSAGTFSIGRSEYYSPRELNGCVRRLSYYNKRLPNAQLQGLTQQ